MAKARSSIVIEVKPLDLAELEGDGLDVESLPGQGRMKEGGRLGVERHIYLAKSFVSLKV